MGLWWLRLLRLLAPRVMGGTMGGPNSCMTARCGPLLPLMGGKAEVVVLLAVLWWWVWSLVSSSPVRSMKLVCVASMMLSLRDRRGGVVRWEFVRRGWRWVRIGGSLTGPSSSMERSDRTSTGESGSSVRSMTAVVAATVSSPSCRGAAGRLGLVDAAGRPRRDPAGAAAAAAAGRGRAPGRGSISGGGCDGTVLDGLLVWAETISTKSSSLSLSMMALVWDTGGGMISRSACLSTLWRSAASGRVPPGRPGSGMGDSTVGGGCASEKKGAA